MFIDGSMNDKLRNISSGGIEPTIAMCSPSTGSDAIAASTAGMANPPLHDLVGEVGAGEARQLEIEQVRQPALIGGHRVDRGLGELLDEVEAGLERVVIVVDLRGQRRGVLEQQRLDVEILVVGMGL